MNPKGTVEQSVNETSTTGQETSAPNTALLASAQSSHTTATDTLKADASPSTQNDPVSPNGQLIDQTTRCEETGETSFCEDQLSHTQQLRNDALPIGNKSEDKKGKKLELENNVTHTLSEELNVIGEGKPRGVKEIADLGEGDASSPSAESTSASQAKNKNSKNRSTKELQSSVSTSRKIGDEPPPQPCTETCQVEEQEKSRLDGTTESTFSGEEDDDEGEIDCKSDGASSSISHDHSSEDESHAPRLRRRCSVSDNDNDEEEEEDYDDDYYFDEKPTHSHGDDEIIDSTKDCKSRGPPITSELHEVDEGDQKDGCQVIDGKNTEANEKGVEKSRLVTPAGNDNKKDPSYVPRVGAFYLHDLRDEVDEAETSSKAQSSVNYCRRPGMLAARWGHDLYVEKHQNPRTTEDIVRRYGYDIRKHGLENPPVESAIENQPVDEGEP
uniref:Protein CASC3 n=1 Tax=Mesocestoides corti TaxID=53468 RepID=A0A5K3ESK0_MESCO